MKRTIVNKRGQLYGELVWRFPAKTDDAITQATVQLGITSDQLEYEVLDKGSTGFLGIGSKNAVIKARKKFSIDENVVEFLSSIFDAMKMEVEILVAVNEEEHIIEVELKGDDMEFESVREEIDAGFSSVSDKSCNHKHWMNITQLN